MMCTSTIIYYKLNDDDETFLFIIKLVSSPQSYGYGNDIKKSFLKNIRL